MCGQVRAEVAGHPDASGNTDGIAADVFGWGNVGSVNGASGVYLGNGWVLTVDHLGYPSGITLDSITNNMLVSTTYDVDRPAIQLRNPYDPNDPQDSNALADLQLFHVKDAPTNLPTLNIASSSPTAGTSFTAIGFGDAAVGPVQYYNQAWQNVGSPDQATYGGYAEGDRYFEHWATNQTVNVGPDGFADSGPDGVTIAYVNVGPGNTLDFFSQFYSGLSEYVNEPQLSESQVGGGDSGGAVFDQFGNLIGISEGIMGLTGQPDETAAFGDMSAYVDLAPYRQEILANMPEPASVSILAIGAAYGLTRRGRRR